MPNQIDFYSSKGVFLHQLYALAVLRQIGPRDAQAVVRALTQ